MRPCAATWSTGGCSPATPASTGAPAAISTYEHGVTDTGWPRPEARTERARGEEDAVLSVARAELADGVDEAAEAGQPLGAGRRAGGGPPVEGAIGVLGGVPPPPRAVDPDPPEGVERGQGVPGGGRRPPPRGGGPGGGSPPPPREGPP